MTSSPTRRCIVCHRILPDKTIAELVHLQAARNIGEGQFIYYCPGERHTEEEIRKAISTVPEFKRAGEGRT
jgi:hypothetical protein